MRPWYRIIIKFTRAAFQFLPVQSRLCWCVTFVRNDATMWKCSLKDCSTRNPSTPTAERKQTYSNGELVFLGWFMCGEINIHTFPVWEWAPPWSEWCLSKKIPDLFVIRGCEFVTSNLLFSIKWAGTSWTFALGWNSPEKESTQTSGHTLNQSLSSNPVEVPVIPFSEMFAWLKL